MISGEGNDLKRTVRLHALVVVLRADLYSARVFLIKHDNIILLMKESLIRKKEIEYVRK